ncbi:conserved hypothetical protein, secreted [Candidatus Magnetomorum sp. HK-1]|nr:conserved hypothetical protein, secreted [Candidatus Magnetomorum sp. HK-1]
MHRVYKHFLLITLIFIFISLPAFADQKGKRIIPQKPDIQKWSVRFNQETLTSYAVIYDARTPDEKQQNLIQRKLSGNVIFLVHGQQQRPRVGFEFVSKLALNSKSGIVVVPVVDTPYGKDPEWRGDRGKFVILMELVRTLLEPKGIRLGFYKKLTEMPVLINSQQTNERGVDSYLPISAQVTIMGWSHGGLLARRIASAYPHTIKGLAQITPAGFFTWGKTRLDKTSCLLSYFLMECLNIGSGIFKGQFFKVIEATIGLTSGTIGDSFRSPATCLSGHFHLLKPFRPMKDMQDCTVLADDSNAPVENLDHIVVMFGASDWVFHPTNANLPGEASQITDKDRETFWKTFYPEIDSLQTQRAVTILPGNHIGPLAYPDKYMLTALKGTDQLLQ